MIEKLNIKCCGEPVSIERAAINGDRKGVGVWCDKCGTSAFNENEETAIIYFKRAMESVVPPARPAYKKETKPKMNNLPSLQDKSKVLALFGNYDHMMEISSPIVDRENGAMKRLIANNFRYVENLQGSGYDKLWSSEQGQMSLIRETEEAMIMGLEMGKLGDIIPFGDDCKFVPTVEGVDFALTNGQNAPFKWIQIDIEYEGDTVQAGRKTGNFFVDFESFGEDRTVVKKVHVYGKSNKTGLIDGETYDAVRLLKKACEHSKPYKEHMKIMDAFDHAKSEGKTILDANGKESFKYFVIKDISNDKYFDQSVEEFRKQEAAGTLKGSGENQYAVQVLPKKSGGTWEKKIYRYEIEGGMEEKIIYPDELSNPYAGPDQPEMLRKTAGKSFMGKYLKTRNSEAAMTEAHTHEEVRDHALNSFDQTIDGEGEEV